MLPTTAQENQIISQIMNIVFGADIAPSEIKGLRIHDETVIIVTSYALYSLGKAYFRQLVEQIKTEKAEAVVTEAEVQVEVEKPAMEAILMDSFAKQYLIQPSLTLEQQQAQEIWACYAVTSEQFDQEVCSGTERGVAVPRNVHERGLINRHALHLRSMVGKLALELKIPNTIMKETRDFMRQRYEVLEQVAKSSSFYSVFHQESIRWQTSTSNRQQK